MVIKAGLNKGFKMKLSLLFIEKNKEVEDKVAERFFQFNETLSDIWELVSFCDKYIEDEKPWEITDVEKQKEVFSNLLYSLNNISKLIEPFLPLTAEKMKEQLKEDNGVFDISKGEVLFPRI
jgi:methionyl-tRNA synthetase